MDGDPVHTVAGSSRPHEDHIHNGCSNGDWTHLRILFFDFANTCRAATDQYMSERLRVNVVR